MKNLFVIILTVCLFTSCEQQKIGYVDNGILINEYQEKIDLEARLQTKISAFQKRTDSLRQSFQLEINEAEIQARNMSQENLQKLSQELQQKEQVLSQRVQFEQQQITQESQSTNDSLVNKVKNFVGDYGKTNGYSFILGSNEAGSVMFGKKESDITQVVLDALNADYKNE